MVLSWYCESIYSVKIACPYFSIDIINFIHYSISMIHYIFDVDGTLTPSRGKIDENFSKFFFLKINFLSYYKRNKIKNKGLSQFLAKRTTIGFLHF